VEEGLLVDQAMVAIEFAMVGNEHDNGVVPLAALLDHAEDLADLVVDEGDIPRVVGPHGRRVVGRELGTVPQTLVEDALRMVVGPLGHRRGRWHVLRGVLTGVGLGRIPGLVGAAEADPTEPGLVPFVGGQVLRRALADVDIGVLLQRESAGTDDVGLVGETLAVVFPVVLPEAQIPPARGHVAEQAGAGTGAADLIHIVEPVGVHEILAFPQVAVVGVKVGLAEEAGTVACLLQGAHPVGARRIKPFPAVAPHARVVAIESSGQRKPRRDADGTGGDGVREADTFAG
jgi:hypothetical protein